MNDAGQFYTNRVLKEWKEKDPVHVEWCRSWIQTLTELQSYIKQYHTTGIVWAGKTKATAAALNGAPSAGAPPPPPPGILLCSEIVNILSLVAQLGGTFQLKVPDILLTTALL